MEENKFREEMDGLRGDMVMSVVSIMGAVSLHLDGSLGLQLKAGLDSVTLQSGQI